MTMLAALGLLAAKAFAGPLDYADKPFAVELASETLRRPGTAYTIKFPSPLKSPFKANDTVWAHLRLPPGPGPHPAILVLPVMAAPNVFIETRFVNRFHKDGFAVMWLEMPYQFNRRPHPLQPSGQAFLARTAKRLVANFRQSALDARRALAYLSSRPDIDAGRIGLFGVSLGAIVGSTVYSVDPTPRYGVFLMGGADFPALARDSSMTGPFIRKQKLDPEELRKAWKGIDPSENPGRNRGKRALLINVRGDTVVPRGNALKLKEAFPDAEQVWLPLGHYTALIHLVWVPQWVSKRFQAALAVKRR